MALGVEVMRFAWWLFFRPSLWGFKNLVLGAIPRIRRLVRIIKENHIDVVYTNTATIFEAAIAARLAGVPHVWHVHEVLTADHTRPKVLPLWLIKRLIGRLSDRVVFESDSAREVCRGGISER